MHDTTNMKGACMPTCLLICSSRQLACEASSIQPWPINDGPVAESTQHANGNCVDELLWQIVSVSFGLNIGMRTSGNSARVTTQCRVLRGQFVVQCWHFLPSARSWPW
ncbi:hypothetical protein ABBQ38_011757 [Trebouxia sp. C0009 RCD-2024]